MKIKISKRKLGLQVAFLILLVPVLCFVLPPIVQPWAIRLADRQIAKWEQLQDDGYALMKARKFEDAEASFRAAIRYAEENLIVQPSSLASSAYALGGVLLLQKRFDEARIYFKRNLLIEKEREGESSPELCPAIRRLVQTCLETNDFGAALDYAQRAVAIREGQSLSPNPELPSALHDLARVYERQKDYTAALRIRQRIVKLWEAMQSIRVRELGIAYYREALMHNVAEDYGTAEALYKKSLRVLAESADPKAECLVLLVRDYAILLDATGRADEASRLRANKGHPSSP